MRRPSSGFLLAALHSVAERVSHVDIAHASLEARVDFAGRQQARQQQIRIQHGAACRRGIDRPDGHHSTIGHELERSVLAVNFQQVNAGTRECRVYCTVALQSPNRSNDCGTAETACHENATICLHGDRVGACRAASGARRSRRRDIGDPVSIERAVRRAVRLQSGYEELFVATASPGNHDPAVVPYRNDVSQASRGPFGAGGRAFRGLTLSATE